MTDLRTDTLVVETVVELDLGVTVIEDVVMRSPYGAISMNLAEVVEA